MSRDSNELNPNLGAVGLILAQELGLQHIAVWLMIFNSTPYWLLPTESHRTYQLWLVEEIPKSHSVKDGRMESEGTE